MAGCAKANTYGGAIRVQYEAGPHDWIKAVEKTCGTMPASEPASRQLESMSVALYAEPEHGEAELLACLRRQPHVLNVGLPV
jgi:hypothetical protein